MQKFIAIKKMHGLGLYFIRKKNLFRAVRQAPKVIKNVSQNLPII